MKVDDVLKQYGFVCIRRQKGLFPQIVYGKQNQEGFIAYGAIVGRAYNVPSSEIQDVTLGENEVNESLFWVEVLKLKVTICLKFPDCILFKPGFDRKVAEAHKNILPDALGHTSYDFKLNEEWTRYDANGL